MFNTETYAENKLIILYVLTHVKTNIDREELAYIIISNIQINYFDIMICINELLESKLIAEMTNSKGHDILMVLPKGKNVIEQLEPNINPYDIELLSRTIEDLHVPQDNRIQIEADIVENNPDDYQILLSLVEDGIQLMKLSVNTPSETDAFHICEKWKNRTAECYAGVIAALTDD